MYAGGFLAVLGIILGGLGMDWAVRRWPALRSPGFRLGLRAAERRRCPSVHPGNGRACQLRRGHHGLHNVDFVADLPAPSRMRLWWS